MAASERPGPDDEMRPVIVARHVALGLEAGMPAYRRGCRCAPCKTANADRMRKYRKRKDAEEHPDRYVETKPEAPAFDGSSLIRIDRLPPGTVTKALLEELPAVDGASPFQNTIKAMMLKSALVLDNADAMDRLDLLNSMQLRVRDGITLLNPAVKGSPLDSLGAELEGLGAP